VKCDNFALIFASNEPKLVLSTESPELIISNKLRDSGCDVKLRKMLKIKVTVQVEKDGDAFYAYCPGLKGLHVDGATEDEAINNAVEAASLYVSSMIQHDDPLPIGADFKAEEQALRHSSVRRTLSRNVEMPWPSAQVCGVN
jgi:predicted RNase H-like HicB family nuclease